MTTILNILRFIRNIRKSVGPDVRLMYFSILFLYSGKRDLQAAPSHVSVTNATEGIDQCLLGFL